MSEDSLNDLRTFIETHLSLAIQDSLDISYAPPGRLPAAVKFVAFGQHFRLERDPDGSWNLATNEPGSRRFARHESEAGFENWLLLAIDKHRH